MNCLSCDVPMRQTDADRRHREWWCSSCGSCHSETHEMRLLIVRAVWSKPSSRPALWVICPECQIVRADPPYMHSDVCHICHNGGPFSRRVPLWKWLLYVRPSTEHWLWLLRETTKRSKRYDKPIIKVG